jgi:hypothetical protein
MFNPFYPFTQQLLDAFIAKGKTFFVRQTFNRAKDHFDEGIKGCFLFSHYDNIVTAQDHYGAVGYDRNRFLYDWNVPAHREKLMIAASGLKEYKVYAAVFRQDWECGVTNRIREKTRTYVSRLGWQPRSGENVATNYELQFGELYLRMRYGTREAKVKFEEIENIL